MKNEQFDYIFTIPDVGTYRPKTDFIDNRHCSIAFEVLSQLIRNKGKLTIILPAQFCISKDNSLLLRINIEENFSIISLKALPLNKENQAMISLTIQKTPPTAI